MIILTLVINKCAHSKWMKLHNEELENLYLSPNFVREIKSCRMRLELHLVCTEETRDSYCTECTI
jgi:hypothetical protein